MSVLVAKQSHFEKVKGAIAVFLGGGRGNCGTCNCGGCANCGTPAGCISFCDVGRCNCGTHRLASVEAKALKDFFG